MIKTRVHRIIFKDHQVVEQVSAQCRQGYIAIAHLLQILLFHLGQQRAEGVAGCPARPQGQGLDEQPHGGLNARQLRRTARSNHAKDHIAAAIVGIAEHNGPQRLNKGGERHRLCFCQFLQACAQGGVQLQFHCLRFVKFPGGGSAGSRLGQLNHGWPVEILQQSSPVGPRRTLIKLRAPAGIGLQRERLRQTAVFRPTLGPGQSKKLPQQHAHAPAVHKQVVEAPAHDHAVGTPAEKARPQQRAALHVKAALPLRAQQGLCFRLGLGLRQMGKVVELKAGAALEQHHAVKLALHRHGKERTQAFVPRGERFPRAHERKNIHRAAKMKFHLLGVNPRLRKQRLIQQGRMPCIRLCDALHILRMAAAGGKNGIQGLLRQIGGQGFQGGKPALEQAGNPILRQALRAEPRPEMQDALLVKKNRKLQRSIRLHVGVDKLGDKPRSQSREHQGGLFVRLTRQTPQIVKGNLGRIAKFSRIFLPQIPIGIAVFRAEMLRKPRAEGFAGLRVVQGRPKRHGADRRKPAKAAAGVKARQKFIAPVAFKCYAHRRLLPLGVQGAGKRGQQIGLGIGAVFLPEALKLRGQTGTAGGAVPAPVPALGQKSPQGFAWFGAGSPPQGALFLRREYPGGAQPLNLAGAQGKAVRFALGFTCAAVMEQALPQGFKRERVQRKVMPHQQQEAFLALPGQHGPQSFAACRIKALCDLRHRLAQQACLLHSVSEIAAVQGYFLRFGQQHGMIRRKGHAQGFVIFRQGLQPCFNACRWHIRTNFQRQQHEELPPVTGMRTQKIAGKWQQGNLLAWGNRTVVHRLRGRKLAVGAFQQGAEVAKVGLAQKIRRAQGGYAAAAQNARYLDSLDGIAAIAEKVAFFLH